MKEFGLYALDILSSKKVTYGDIRIISTKDQNIVIRNGQAEFNSKRSSLGFGIRVFYDGAWGFAASYDLSKKSIGRIAEKAIGIAKESSRYKKSKVVLSPYDACDTADFVSPYKLNPFDISEEEKLALLIGASLSMKTDPKILYGISNASFREEDKLFMSTHGQEIRQRFVQTGAGITAIAFHEGEVAKRSYPASFGGDFRNAGWEFVKELDLQGKGPVIAGEAVELLTAPGVPHTNTTLVLEGSQLALQIHESCGHPTELDRVLGFERTLAGTSFLTLDKLYDLKYGSDIVNITSDATNTAALGGFAYDDEGIPAQCSFLVKDGLFVGYQTSRETAPVIGQCSNGCMRADGYHNIPLIRMTSINLLPGEHSFESIISEVEDGFYFALNKSWSIDDKRLNFQFGCEIAWEIKKGKLGKIFKNPSYTGITPEFWGSCDAIGSAEHYRIWGIPNCGKGEPSQTARVSHGASFARFRNVEVGVSQW